MKILAVGDSFTFGEELPDIPLPGTNNRTWANRPPASAFSYASLLGQRLNTDVTNLSMPGGSNSRIFRVTMDESSKQQYDIVICGWTEISRLDIRYNNKDFPATINGRLATSKFPWVNDYYKLHYTDEHAYLTWLSQIIALQNHFKLNNQKYLFSSMQGITSIDSQFDHLVNQVDTDYYLGWYHEGLTEWMGDAPKGPNGHPLELGHERIADKIYEHIRNLGWLP